MSYFSEFLRQETPAPKKVMPGYYRKALIVSEVVLTVYFLAVFFLLPLIDGRWEWVPAVLCAVTGLAARRIGKLNILQNFLVFSAIVLFWSGWGIHFFGWGSGVQHFLVIILLLLFFNICISPPWKVLASVLILVYIFIIRTEFYRI